MRTYENKDELKNEINKSFAKYISEFNDIPEHLKDKRIDEIDRTPAENLAYQVGWTTLVIKCSKVKVSDSTDFCNQTFNSTEFLILPTVWTALAAVRYRRSRYRVIAIVIY